MGIVLAGALVIGLTLGLLGSGGSIMTVPILVYLVGQPEKLAIAGSLAIVGSISLIAATPFAIRGEVLWRQVLWFGLAGMIGSFLGAHLASHLPGALQLSLFACVMLAAAMRMARSPAAPTQPVIAPPRARRWMVRDGLMVGLLTGVVGIGGGFLIVPALVLLGGLGMRSAIGTSLIIISLNALSGFVKHASALSGLGLRLDWTVIAQFVVIGGSSALIGQNLGSRLPQAQLKRGFALMLVVMGVYMLWRETPRLF